MAQSKSGFEMNGCKLSTTQSLHRELSLCVSGQPFTLFVFPAKDQIPSGTCLVPFQTGHNPLMDTVVPLRLGRSASVCCAVQKGRVPKPLGCISATLSRCFGLTSSAVCVFVCVCVREILFYLVSLIQATSWSRAWLISFTPRDEPVCGQTAHYGDDPQALQVTN